MKKIWIGALLLSLFINAAYSQSVLKGVVKDQSSGEVLPGANVVLINDDKGVSTDKDGVFIFHELTPGEHRLKASFVGYEEFQSIYSVDNNGLEVIIELIPKSMDLEKVTIVSSRTRSELEDMPGQVDVMDAKEIEGFPASNTDDLLRGIANINVNRSWGIFSKNSSVTMRGLDAAQSILVLYNGVPLNKTAGGAINWHMISPDRIERIEVIKGPASALYGNNAMGGVINIITKKSDKPVEFDGRISASTYNTFGTNLNVSGRKTKDEKEFYWGLNGFYRQGDGYVMEPYDSRDSTDVPIYLKEGRIGSNLGYRFNKDHAIDIEYSYYEDKRGDGIKTFEADGGYLKYTTNFIRAKYDAKFGKTYFDANIFYQHEDYYSFTEKYNDAGDSYKMYYREQVSRDYGVWLSANREIFKNNTLSYGADFKNGYMDASDIYITSTDKLMRGGSVSYYAIFLQDEWKLFNKRLILQTGIRADYSSFYDGYLDAQNPTDNTGFDAPVYEEFKKTEWTAFSPKVSLQYNFKELGRTYISYSRGFMPPKLDDLVSSRKINKGFKIANPELQPQSLDNFEWGGSLNLAKKLFLETSVYYSIGRDFQYFVETGQDVDGNREVIRENISEVEIMGAEFSVKYNPIKSLTLKANYSYNQSEITEFDLSVDEDDNLKGMELTEVPGHQVFGAVFWNNKFFHSSLVCSYTGEAWLTDNNTAKVDDYTLFDFRISKVFKKHYQVSFDIQNIFDKQYVDKKLRMAPGRFMTLEIAVKF